MPKPPPLSPEARRLVAVGTTLFGERWQSPLARGMGVVPSALNMIASGERPVTPAIEEALLQFLEKHAEVLRQRIEFLTEVRAMVEDELSPEPDNEGPRFGQ